MLDFRILIFGKRFKFFSNKGSYDFHETVKLKIVCSYRSNPDLVISKISISVTSRLAQGALGLPFFQKYTLASHMKLWIAV